MGISTKRAMFAALALTTLGAVGVGISGCASMIKAHAALGEESADSSNQTASSEVRMRVRMTYDGQRVRSMPGRVSPMPEPSAGGFISPSQDDFETIDENDFRRVADHPLSYENRLLAKEDFNDDTVDAGEIGAGHSVVALYEVVPVGVALPSNPAVDALKYSRPSVAPLESISDEWLTVKLRYKQPDGDTSQRLAFPLRDDAMLADVSQSDDFAFATAVAAFGQKLRGSEHVGGFSYDAVLELARPALGEDRFGHRAGFLELVRSAKALSTKGD